MVIERDITHKFEKLGWKIGKNLHNNVCPDHPSREKFMTDKKVISNDKVVLMSSAATPAPRGPTRDGDVSSSEIGLGCILGG